MLEGRGDLGDGESSGAPVSIIVPAFNELEYCRQCIASIRTNTRAAYELILVDNGSSDGVGEFFDSVPGAKVIHTGSNLGFAGGVNRGLEAAKGHALLLNSDTLVPESWLDRLTRALLSEGDIGAVGPRSNCVPGSQAIEGLEFNRLEEINAFSESLARRRDGEIRDVARLIGFCMLIRAEAREAVGYFDEGYGVGNFEDDDYCLRVIRAGYRLCVAEDAFVFHYGNRTFVGMGVVDEHWDQLMAQNQAYFEGKWEIAAEERCDAVQSARQLNRRARTAFERGDTAGAVRLYRDAITEAPTYEVSFNDLAVLLWELGEHERSYENFLRALRLHPGYSEGRENLMAAAKALGKTEEAARFLEALEEDAGKGQEQACLENGSGH